MNESSTMLAWLAGVTTAGFDLKKLLRGMVDVLREILGEVQVTVYLPDQEAERLVAQRPDRRTVSLDEGEIGRAWQTGALQRVAIGGSLAVPLRTGENVFGVIEIQPARDEVLDEDSLLCAQVTADQVALAIENAWLREENTSLSAENERLYRGGLKLLAELSTLNEIMQSLNTELDVDRLLAVIHQQTSRVIDTTNFYIALLDQDLQQITFPFCVDQGQQVEESPRLLRSGSGFGQEHTGQKRTEWIVRAGEPLFLLPGSRHAFMEKELSVSPCMPRCYLGVPLIVGEWVVGVMAVQNYEREDAFAREDLRLLVTIAAQAGVVISNARLFKETQAALNKLQEAYKIQEALADTVRELSAPVIQIWEDVLAMPLVGAIDAARAQRITENLLEGISRRQAKAVIIDVTGVPVVDVQTAHHLLQAIRAARLLGAHCILTGISADVARTMVTAGIRLAGVTTLTDLQAGIRYVMAGGWREAGLLGQRRL